MRVLAVVMAVVSGGAIGASALQQQAPARDATTLAPTVGTAVVSGIVVNDEEPGQPVRRAIVVLSGDGLRPSRSAITDDDGRFGFTDLPGGKFSITVSRASFVTSMYGAKRAGRPGVSLVVADGARVANVPVRLWRGAAVAGTLRDETGAPVAGIQVRAFPARAKGPLLSLSNNGTTTDERGQFRIFGLEPGTYAVAALPPASSSSPYLGLSDAQTDAALEALRRRTAAVPGSMPAPAPAPSTEPAPRSFAYAPIFFPGTPVAPQAATITLAAGESRGGLDFALQRVPTSVVSGVVLRADGTPAAQASLQLTSIAPPGPLRDATRVELTATAASDGSFKIAQVRPGEYELAARVPVDLQQPGVRPGYIEAPSTPQFYAVMNLSVAGGDVSGLTLSAGPGIKIRARLVFESDSRKPPNLINATVRLIPEIQLPLELGSGLVRSVQIPPAARPNFDGTFEFPGVAPGRYWLMTTGAGVPAEWQLKSALVAGRDILDDLLEVPAGGGPLDLVITYDDRPARLSGRLETASGAPASDVFVVAFAADREKWGPYTRRIKAVRPGQDGSFAIDGLPAGDYLLAAVTDADPEDWQSPEFLQQLAAVSVKVSLTAGKPVVQNLRIGG